MKKLLFTGLAIMALLTVQAQENEKGKEKNEPDTTNLNMGKTKILIINNPDKDADSSDVDTDEGNKKDKGYSNDGHWAGIDFGVTMLMNNQFQTSFPSHPQWENDPSRSFNWSLNIFDHRFNLYRDRIGITTGVGLNLARIGIKNNQVLLDTSDSLWVFNDSINTYSKNKLRATYLQIPLLFEFNSSSDTDKSFWLTAGVVGGVRLGSSTKRKIEKGTFESKEKIKGVYGLNPFKLDGTVRMGYGNWGLFANYSLIPLFDTDKTAEVYPLTFGISLVF